jgi:eukaryotic-like serine/threonine-protein kinase
MTDESTKDDEVTRALDGSVPSASRDAELPPGTVLGSYAIQRVVGRGGMGIVYEATHRELGKRAAVKVTLPQFALREEIRTRFLREGRAASRIRHRHVVDVYDLGTVGHSPYLVMEYLEGETLGALLKREGRLSGQRVTDLMIPVLCALRVAHELGIIHRDLKPDNIFLSSERGGPVVPKIVDFGISKILAEDRSRGLTNAAALLGSPHYISPEQAEDARSIGAGTDQYAVAVIMYEACVGLRPFRGDSLLTVLTAIVLGNAPSPRASVPDLPEELEAIIMRGMQKDPADRFPSVGAMGRALLPFASERVRLMHQDELSHPKPSSPPSSEPR